MATDGGFLFSESANVRISFVNVTAEPYFASNTWTTDFTENEEGMDETRTLPEAIDPKNIDGDFTPIYYFIDGEILFYHFAELFLKKHFQKIFRKNIIFRILQTG